MSFQFKQFKINHHPNVFKFGTDAALLATWANIEDSKNVLEIGTGSGVISFMMAQRNPYATYTGIDFSSEAIQLAKENLSNYPILAHIKFRKSSLQEYIPNSAFDHIISNPPFFENSTKSPSKLKNNTRHTDTLPLVDLLTHSKRLLSPNGKISLIYPIRYLDQIRSICDKLDLHIHKIHYVRSKPERELKRVLLELSTQQGNLIEHELIIEGPSKGYSSTVFQMFQPFYLKL
jgi:tRNA1Val (adenine37-N6)-methyltransferase